MSEANQLLKEFGFPKAHLIANKKSIANIWKKQRCGIYVLGFSNGDYYIGQSVDVTKRFQQHRQTWGDIEKVSFKRVARKDLNQVEESLVKLFECNGHKLRNIVYTTPGKIPYGMSDFDLIMSPGDQERWLVNPEFITPGGNRLTNDEQRMKYAQKYQRFQKMPYAEEITNVLREYVRNTIPPYQASEMLFWSCTCLLSKYGKDIVTYSRINLNWQLVFEAYMYKGKPEFSIYVAKSPIEKDSKLKNMLHSVRLAWRGAWPTKHQYKPGGQDQVNFSVFGCNDMLDLIHNPEMLKAMRLFNLRLMRRGPCISSQFHCFDLADKLVEEKVLN